jgi:hypothetical protein
MKRIILAFLILTVPRLCPAKYSGGAGTASAPYEISSTSDLLTLAEDINDYNKCFILTADIDFDPNLAGGQIFATAVIARDTNNAKADFEGSAFSGVFDGAGHKISNLIINTNGSVNDYLGLFGYACGGEIKKLHLINFSIIGADGSQWLGALAGYNCSSISDCSSSGVISGGTDLTYAGGLVGENSGRLNNCSSTASVTGANGAFFIGGLAGYNYKNDISGSFSAGAVICGESSGYIGGLTGYNFGGDISNCNSAGNVTGGNSSNSIGGLTGENGGEISNCYSTGIVSGEVLYDVGGLTGWSDGGISSSYFLVTNGPANGFGTPLTDAQMKQQTSFTGWDFNDVWRICESSNYPKLLRQILPADYLCPDGVDFLDFAFLAGHWLQTDYGNGATVDLAAFAELADYWQQTDCGDCGGTDYSGDGNVDSADLAIFCNNWLQMDYSNLKADLFIFAVLADYWQQTDCGDCGGADYSGDGNVDSEDLAILCDNWLAVEYGDVDGAEITGDGVVDIDDLISFSSNWLK